LDVIHTIAQLRARLKSEPSVALVPTMGNLHDGHISLVDLAKRHGRCVVTSIFVNRLQFEAGGDFDRYPRTFPTDCAKLEKAGAHVVFAPDEREMYPTAQEIAVTPPKVAEALEGEHRPGHFQGVATVARSSCSQQRSRSHRVIRTRLHNHSVAAFRRTTRARPK